MATASSSSQPSLYQHYFAEPHLPDSSTGTINAVPSLNPASSTTWSSPNTGQLPESMILNFDGDSGMSMSSSGIAEERLWTGANDAMTATSFMQSLADAAAAAEVQNQQGCCSSGSYGIWNGGDYSTSGIESYPIQQQTSQQMTNGMQKAMEPPPGPASGSDEATSYGATYAVSELSASSMQGSSSSTEQLSFLPQYEPEQPRPISARRRITTDKKVSAPDHTYAEQRKPLSSELILRTQTELLSMSETPSTVQFSHVNRLDNSLLVLTKKFMQLQPQPHEDGLLNLNDAAARLGVQKRRLYDITNVLEGIDMIEKTGKNSIRWKSCDERGARGMEAQRLKEENRILEEREQELDDLISNVTSALKLAKEDPTDRVYSYVKYMDLRKLPRMSDQTLIAVKAPKDSYSSIDVTDPVESRKFEVMIRNTRGDQLEAYLCPYLTDEKNRKDKEGSDSTADEVRQSSWSEEPQQQLQPMLPMVVSGGEQHKLPVPGPSNEDDEIISISSMLLRDNPVLNTPSNLPMSPLKMVVDEGSTQQAGGSSNSEDVETNPYGSLSLDPVEDNEPYMFSMDDQESMQNLFDWP